jgi:cobalt/nickel transport system permease protein
MEHGFLDKYSGLDSPVHRLDARVKAIVALFFILLVVTTPPQHLLAFVVYSGLLVWTAALARVPLAFVAGRAVLVLPFSALVALGLPFLGGGETVAVLGMSLSVKGLWVLAGAAMKSLLGVATLALLVSTTPFSSLLAGLRGLGAPTLFIDLLSLTYRYLFVLVGEAMRLRRAAVARGYHPKWLPQAIIVGRLAGNLFVRSYERAERAYGAMLLRGYCGRMPTARPLQFRMTDAVVLVTLLPALIALRILVS